MVPKKVQALMLDSTGQWTIRRQVNEGIVMFMAKYGHFVEPIPGECPLIANPSVPLRDTDLPRATSLLSCGSIELFQ